MRDIGRGTSRRIVYDFSDGCWLNARSAAEIDASGLLVSAYTGCICGFCVDAELPTSASAVLEEDLHWTDGPWVRLDGGVRALRSVQILPPGPLRLGRNLRTGSGTFGAGGLLFRSERPGPAPDRENARRCAMVLAFSGGHP